MSGSYRACCDLLSVPMMRFGKLCASGWVGLLARRLTRKLSKARTGTILSWSWRMPNRKRYYGKSVAHYFPDGAQNPIKYVNC